MVYEHFHIIDNTTGVCVTCGAYIEDNNKKEQFDDMWCQDSWFPEIQYVEKEQKKVLFYAIKGTLEGTVAVFPLDDFSRYILKEEQSNTDLLDYIYSILPDNERHLLEYHSRFDGIDNVEVWCTILKDKI